MDIGEVVKVYDRNIWIEEDFLGRKHVMVMHDCEGMEPFVYCTFNYDHRYTSNSSIRQCAINMAESLGAKQPIEFKYRELNKDDWRVESEKR